MRGRKRHRKKAAKKLQAGLAVVADAAKRAAESTKLMIAALKKAAEATRGVSFPASNPRLKSKFEGTLTKPVKFKAYPGETVTINPKKDPSK